MPNYYLRGRIVAKFRSVKAFAKVVNWSTRKAYDIVNGKQEPTSGDIDDMCRVLDVDVSDEFRLLFLVRC